MKPIRYKGGKNRTSLLSSQRKIRERRNTKKTEEIGRSVNIIHCGVVGNIQASHVCAPGSIPGDGVFLYE